MSGNVVPQKGPTMEQVYDSMKVEQKQNIIKPVQVTIQKQPDRTFHKLPNPELKMYVYPHLAGNDGVPIPGYFTEFNAYTHDHYELPSETIRE